MIHPTAEISPAAIIGQNVAIWHHAQVREGAVIGNNCILAKGAYIDKNVIIGDNCKIQNYSSLYHGVTVERNVFIGPHSVLTNDKVPRATNPDGTSKTDRNWKENPILVREGSSIGARVVVLPGIVIGKFAMIGAGSVVTKDIPNFGLVYGNPARLQGYVCRCGRTLEAGKNAGELCPICDIS